MADELPTVFGFWLVILGMIMLVAALFGISELPADEHAEAIGPYVYAFVLGCAIALIGAFLLAGQLFWRLL